MEDVKKFVEDLFGIVNYIIEQIEDIIERFSK